MKTQRIAIAALSVLTALSSGATTIRINGAGRFVCSAQTISQGVPSLARGLTRREAEARAIQECGTLSGGDSFFCNVSACEEDTRTRRIPSLIYDVIEDANQITIDFRGPSRYSCVARARGQVYVANAPTRLEAQAVAKRICAFDQGTSERPDGFFCNTSNLDCEQISNSRAVEGALEGVLNSILKK